MSRGYYANYFSRERAKPPTQEELWQRHTDYLRNLAQSEFGESCVRRFNVPEVDEAEEEFKVAISAIKDPELKNTIDMAAGRISSAYQILGFCAGNFSQDSRARGF